ncbi:Rossmann-fold NAD(P)-binding domain-containing protein [Ectopseudomonas mendocina]|uniref:hypothetical protein n=1 Tax=Ectopseudomonas mendocina TaxID=300 RepID=UPI000A600B60|nr:hypothetical protein [Pseudomonas mendocina]
MAGMSGWISCFNNAARNPKVESVGDRDFSRLENFPWEQWRLDLDVGSGGAFNCAKVFGAEMARQGRGVIVNIAFRSWRDCT